MANRLDFEPRWFVVIIFFVAGIFAGSLGLFVWFFNGNYLVNIQKIHTPVNSKYKYINPLLAIEVVNNKNFLENLSLGNKVEKIINTAKRNKKVQEGSFYSQDMEHGFWTGVNEDQNFSTGKFLRVPIMMAYFQLAQSDPTILSNKLVYQQLGFTQNPQTTEFLVDGQSYTVEDLIRSMIIDDNEAASTILFENVDNSGLNEIYSDLGINFKEDKYSDDYISVKQFSILLRVLYNATYLNREFSEKALAVLAESNPTNGVGLGLQNDLKISQRYRIRSYTENGQTFLENHACGIIYYPQHPYLVCLMSIAKNKSDIDNLFREINTAVYNYAVETYGLQNY